MESSKILYLSYDGMTDPLGQSQVLPYLTGLAEKGWDITLVSFEKPERAAEQPSIAHSIAAAGITWKPMRYHKSPPVLSTLYDLQRLKKQIAAWQADAPFGLVHCRGYITALAGQWMKQTYGVKMVFDMRGFFADERVEGGLWNLKNPVYRAIYRFFKKKEREFLTGADYNICLTHKGASILQGWFKNEGGIPVKVIPCCVDMELFDPKKVSPAERESRLAGLGISSGRKVFAYLGSIGTWYMLNEMLDFFQSALQQFPNAVFLFITKESREQIFVKAAERGIPEQNLRVVSAQRQEVPKLLSIADASVFFIKPVFSKQASSPTKQGELMAMGIPVICNSGVGDTDHVIERYGAGCLVKDCTLAGYRQALHNWQQLMAQGFDAAAVRKGASEFFALPNGVMAYHEVYQAVLGRQAIVQSKQPSISQALN